MQIKICWGFTAILLPMNVGCTSMGCQLLVVVKPKTKFYFELPADV